MLQNVRIAACTISKILKENQQKGGSESLNHPPFILGFNRRFIQKSKKY